MAEVFRATEPRPAGEPRVVVLKRMLPSIAAEPGSRSMFQAEAELGAHVRHPNVVEVLDVGAQDDQPFLVLEYVRGVDLWRLMRWLRRAGKGLDVELSLFVVREMLAGLHAVHEATDAAGRNLGIVHRDVSPSNVLLSIHGDVKLGDFGIACSRMREQMPVAPLSERAKGKLGYLAPEQVVGAPVDRRADVFSAAVLAAELLMGRPLFSGGSELAVLLAIRDAKIHPFIEVMHTLPTGLGEVLMSALARDPSDRTATAAELARSLSGFQTERDDGLRRRMAELVKPVLRSASIADMPAVLDPEATPLVPIEDESDRRTPVHMERETVPAPEAEEPPTRERPVTAGVPAVLYEIQTTAGETHGPLTYAQVIEAVATGRLGPDDRVREQGGAFSTVQERSGLRRHLPPSTMTPTTRRREAPNEADEVVPLAHGGIVTALGWSTLRKDTGLWLCEAGGVRKEVYLESGVPEFVTSNVASELLGEFLVAREVISRGELDMALAVMPRFEGKLGDTLAALGLVEPVHLFQHIAAQVREKLLDLFAWTSGQAELYLGVPPPDISFPLGLDPWATIDEGIRRRVLAGHERDRFSGRERASVQQVMDVPREVNRAALPSFVRRVLATLHRPTPLDELERSFDDPTGNDPGRTRRAVVLLMHLNAVEWSSP